MNVVRLNQRNCGDTEHLSAGLFHSGLTADAAHVIDELIAVDGLTAIAVAGLFARRQPGAEAGRRARRDAADGARRRGGGVADHRDRRVRARARTPRELRCINGTSCKDLKRRMRRKEQFRPGRFDLSALDSDQHRSRLRRGVHRTAFRVPQAPRTTTIAPAPCGSSTASASRR